jgi:hypothetical protein
MIPPTMIVMLRIADVVQFNHEWGGKPWEDKSKALSQK